MWYDICTNVDRGYFWCSIDTVFKNRFAPCSKQCPVLARVLVQTDSGKLHTSCQPLGSSFTLSLYPDQTTINTILNLHNNARSTVSPTASSMSNVSWDFRLVRLLLSMPYIY